MTRCSGKLLIISRLKSQQIVADFDGGRLTSDAGALLLREVDRWMASVNRPQTEAELDAVRCSVVRGASYGQDSWQRRAAARLKLQSSLRPPWRPKLGKHGKIK